MSFHVFFGFSTGLAKPITVPAGTLDSIRRHMAAFEAALGLKTEPTWTPEGEAQRPGFRYTNKGQAIDAFNPPKTRPDGTTYRESKGDEELCRLLENHAKFVRRFYRSLSEWSKLTAADWRKKKTATEKITPEQAQEFWHALQTTPQPDIERWSANYYKARMEAVYEALRGRDNGEGFSADCEPLTEKQASAVICVFSQWMDNHDLRLEAPHDVDSLRSSYDGGYTWCETCGAVAEEYVDEARAGQCGRASRKKCDLHQEAVADEARERKHEADLQARAVADLIQDSRPPGETIGKATLQDVLDCQGYSKGWRRREAQLKTWRKLQHAVKLGYLTHSATTPPVYTRTNRSTGRTGRL